jgi:hypothetical protein
MNSNRVLLFCAAVSIPTILAGGFLRLPWYIIGPISIVPLLIYWYSLHRCSSLNQQQIDSVYYFGFLLTLAYLLASVIEFSTESFGSTAQEQVVEIASKFALGLIATGIGLVGRLLLLPKRFSLESTDDAIQKQIQQVDNLVFQFQKTIDLFQQLREEAINQASKGAEQATLAVVETIKGGLEESVSSLSTTVNRLQTEISSLDVRALESLAKSGLQLSKSFDQLSSKTPDTSVAFQALSSNLQSLNTQTETAGIALAHSSESADKASSALERLGSLDLRALESVNQSLITLSESLSKVDASPLADLGSTASTTSSSLDQLRAVVPDLSTKVQGLGGSVDSLSRSAANASQSLEAVKQSFASIGGSIESFRQLESVMQEASLAMQKFSQSVGSLDDSAISQLGSTVESIIAKFTEFSALIQGIRTTADQSVKDVAEDIKKSSSNINQQITQLDQAASALVSTLSKYSQALRAATVRNFGS